MRFDPQTQRLVDFGPVNLELNSNHCIIPTHPQTSWIVDQIERLKLAQTGRLYVANLVMTFLLPLCAGLDANERPSRRTGRKSSSPPTPRVRLPPRSRPSALQVSSNSPSLHLTRPRPPSRPAAHLCKPATCAHRPILDTLTGHALLHHSPAPHVLAGAPPARPAPPARLPSPWSFLAVVGVGPVPATSSWWALGAGATIRASNARLWSRRWLRAGTRTRARFELAPDPPLRAQVSPQALCCRHRHRHRRANSPLNPSIPCPAPPRCLLCFRRIELSTNSRAPVGLALATDFAAHHRHRQAAVWRHTCACDWRASDACMRSG